ncbi:nicotinate (nicotinamide) nucleotide adenylyltransferase [Candidatus Roizmanbacteria bacterium]|nr:nicotinate (nicotinamide) nucleotide adenylyltransferase [Candidatus Roizmanbacteria bacterium]
MKIAILGGSFDPPHLGHWSVALQVKEMLKMDEVWLMPCASHPFNKKMSPANDRLAMTGFLVDEELGIKVSDFEIKKDKISYTVDTLDKLTRLFPDYQINWVIGSDQIKEFARWYHWQDIIERYPLIVFPRERNHLNLGESFKKYTGLKKIPPSVIFLDQPEVIISTISSTAIKKRLVNNQSIRFFVPEKVEKYIREKKLYNRL